MQFEITAPMELLDDQGFLVEPGWARKPYWRYDREKIKAPWYRIKEWDYYAILSQDKKYGIAITVAELGYAAICAVCWLDYKARTSTELTSRTLFSRGKLQMPASSQSGNIKYEDANICVEYLLTEGNRRILVHAPAFKAPDGKRGLRAELELMQAPDSDSMSIATSWEENRKAFYYNQKINCMAASGKVLLGNKEYVFTPEFDFGCLDWGRGNWPYKVRWYWSSASGMVNGKPFGWNLGYGFSDRTKATENLIFYCGKAHKLDQILFHMDTHDYLKPWRFSSNDKRLDLEFTPILDRHSTFNIGIIKSIPHQVFGIFNGSVILDDGTTLHIRDLLGFAEDVLNWW